MADDEERPGEIEVDHEHLDEEDEEEDEQLDENHEELVMMMRRRKVPELLDKMDNDDENDH